MRSASTRIMKSSKAIARSERSRRMRSKLARVIVKTMRSEEHTSELQSQSNIVCRLLLEKNKAATLLRGKEKTVFTPHVDTGDFVIVVNADKVRVTGKKEEQKTFMSFSGYVGGHKSENVP